MGLALVILAALAPVILLFSYIQGQDAKSPEPKPLLYKGFGYGVCSALAVIVLLSPLDIDGFAQALGPVGGGIFTAFFGAAIPEETAKLFFLWLLLRKNPYFDEHLDGVVYATCIGLGFAGFENILYLFSNLDNFVSTAVMRALFSVPGHFIFAITMGYFISLASFSSRSRIQRRWFLLLAWIVPVLFHGIFDALLMVADSVGALQGVLVVAFVVFCHFLRKGARRRIYELRLRD